MIKRTTTPKTVQKIIAWDITTKPSVAKFHICRDGGCFAFSVESPYVMSRDLLSLAEELKTIGREMQLEEDSK